jgi:hypothetical protein
VRALSLFLAQEGIQTANIARECTTVITKFDKAMMHYSLERHGAFYPSVKGDQKVIGGGATRIVRPHLIISRTD